MARGKRCVACVEHKPAEARQIRVYAKRKQWLFYTVLCTRCWGGLFELLRESSDGCSESMFAPPDEAAIRDSLPARGSVA